VTVFDRYLLGRFFQIFAIFFIAAIGLFAVVDGFTNLDAFQQASKDHGTMYLFALMAKHYFYQSALLVDLVGPTITVLAVLVVLMILIKNGELHPVLAAGVPTYRLALPLVIGVLAVNGVLIGNQEWLLPKIAPHLQGNHGDTAEDDQTVLPQYDPKWRIFVSGKTAIPGGKKITLPNFQLPAPTLANDFVSLKGKEAVFVPGLGKEPSGWLVKDVTSNVSKLGLTEQGRTVIIPQPNGTDVFVASTLTFEQLCSQASNHRLVPTRTLFQRLRQPSGSLISRNALLVHLHGRLTRPILTLIGLFLVVPLIVRKDRMSPMQQVTNIAICMGVLGGVMGLSMLGQFLGQSGILRPDQAVWSPLILGSSIAGWLTGSVRT